MPRKKTAPEVIPPEPWIDQGVKPWEQLKQESGKAYRAFQCYRDLGLARSQVEVARQLGFNTGYIHQIRSWVDKFHWNARIRAWDLHNDRVRQEAVLDENVEMSIRHAAVAKKVLKTIELKIDSMLHNASQRYFESDGKDFDVPEVSGGQIAQLLSVASNLERLSLGEPTSRHQTVDFQLPTSLPPDVYKILVTELEKKKLLPGSQSDDDDVLDADIVRDVN